MHRDGFADVTRSLTLTLGARVRSVTFDWPLPDSHRTSPCSADRDDTRDGAQPDRRHVPQAEVQSLPMNGRNFLDLALLIPGVSPTNIGSTQLFPETSAVPGQGISVASQRNLSNSFIVDGLSANDDAAGLSGIPYGVDAVEQFQVVTSGGQAELGRALGGYVNVVTKSGTNRCTGRSTTSSATTLQRGERAVGHDAADGPAAVRRQSRRAARAQPDVLLRERRAAHARSDRPRHDPSARTCRRSTRGWRGRISGRAGDAPASIRIPLHSTNFLGKLDHQLSGSDQFTVAVQPVPRDVRQLARCRRLNAPSASAGLDNVDHVGRDRQHVDALAERP